MTESERLADLGELVELAPGVTTWRGQHASSRGAGLTDGQEVRSGRAQIRIVSMISSRFLRVRPIMRLCRRSLRFLGVREQFE